MGPKTQKDQEINLTFGLQFNFRVKTITIQLF